MNKLENIASVSIDVFISQILETIHIIFNKKEFSYFLTVVGFIYFFFFSPVVMEYSSCIGFVHVNLEGKERHLYMLKIK